MSARHLLRTVADALFVISLVVLFGTLSLRWLVSDVGWYRANFQENAISARTGIGDKDLSASAQEISRYLLLQRDRVDDLSVTVGGQVRPLFNDREVLHLGHVRGLLASFYTLQWVAMAYPLLYLVASRLLLGRGFRRQLGRELRWAGLATVGAFGLFGFLSMLDFDELFLQFHLVSFQGDCWLFDGTKDNLVMMFPQNFWNDSAVRLAEVTVAQALAAFFGGALLIRSLDQSGEPAAR